MKVNAELKERILELKEEWLKNQEISDVISAEIGETLSKQLIGYHLKKMYSETSSKRSNVTDSIDNLNDIIIEWAKYELEKDNIVFYKTKTELDGWKFKEKVSVPIELVSDIVYDYSRHGWNITWPAIVKKYALKPMVWSQLKNRLWIYKDTNACPEVVLDYIANKYWEEEAEAKIVEVSYRAIQDKHVKKYKDTYDDIFKKEAKKALKTLANIDNFLEHIQEYIKSYKPIEFKGEIPTLKNNDTIEVWFWDIHLGKNWTDLIIKRIKKLTDYLIKRQEKNINLLFLWDLVETLVEGWMHDWQVEGMDWIFWFDLIMLAVTTLENMLLDLYKAWKTVTFTWIAWNHDRLGKSHDQDQDRTWALIIYELVKRWLKNIDIKINMLTEKTNTLELDTFNYTIHHWDGWFAKKAQTKPEDILRKNGIKNKHNVVMYADRHNVHINETKGATCVWTPALAWQGPYDKRLDLHSEPWVVIIEKNEDWLPDILIKRFK